MRERRTNIQETIIRDLSRPSRDHTALIIVLFMIPILIITGAIAIMYGATMYPDNKLNDATKSWSKEQQWR